MGFASTGGLAANEPNASPREGGVSVGVASGGGLAANEANASAVAAGGASTGGLASNEPSAGVVFVGSASTGGLAANEPKSSSSEPSFISSLVRFSDSSGGGLVAKSPKVLEAVRARRSVVTVRNVFGLGKSPESSGGGSIVALA